MDQTQAAPEAHITYYGGKWVAFAPILLAIVGLIYIAVKQADVPEYWVVFLLPMIVCLFLAKDKTAYCEAIIEGATNKVGGILTMAVLLARICGQLIETSGLVDTLAMLYTFTSGAPTQEEKTCRDTLHRKFDSCFSDPNTSI